MAMAMAMAISRMMASGGSCKCSRPASLAMAMALLLLLLLQGGARTAEAGNTITCGTVTSSLSSCLAYLTGKGGGPATTKTTPSSGCCSGVRSLYAATKSSRPNRVAACKCIVSTATGVSGLLPARVAGLPSACGVNLGYKPSPTTNCASIP